MTEERIIETFNGIKFLKSDSCSGSRNFNSPALYNVFMCIVNKNNLEVTQQDLQQMLNNDINIDLATLSSQLVAVLVDALMYYIIRWPGWQKHDEYQNGTLKVEEWFTRFHQYLIFKSRDIIRTSAKTPELKDECTQTDVPSSKGLAPYALRIEAPLFVLNNIVFEQRNRDVLLRKCTERRWRNPCLQELLHFPNVCVALKLPDISLSRYNNHHIERYMGLSSDIEIPLVAEHISHIKKILLEGDPAKRTMQPYSFDYFKMYFEQLLNTLSTLPGVLNSRLQEVESVLHEFLCDVQDANVNNRTMCTNISVRYNIGKCTYLRNRRTVLTNSSRTSTNQNDVSYYERITPQMDFSLYQFNAEQDMSDVDDISFVSLNRLQHKLKTSSTSEITNLVKYINASCLMYSCILCRKNVVGIHAQYDLIKHLKDEHRAEQSVLCYKCYREFDVYTLAMYRWSHQCIKQDTNEPF